MQIVNRVIVDDGNDGAGEVGSKGVGSTEEESQEPTDDLGSQ